MSAGVCGKRVGFEELLGSTSPTACSSAKRTRWSIGSPIQSDFGSGSEDSFSFLLQMFPSLDAELVETILKNNNNKIEDATQALRMLSFDDANARNNVQSFNPPTSSYCSVVPNKNVATSSDTSHGRFEEVTNIDASLDSENGTKWVDIFVQEMMNATNLEDARLRAARILEAFEQSITMHHTRVTEELRNASLKEHLQSLINDNQVLKKAVAIQHERNLEHEEKAREVQQLKSMLSQYQEQVRNLELSNYSLNLHLQRAQESSSIPGQFHPDIF